MRSSFDLFGISLPDRSTTDRTIESEQQCEIPIPEDVLILILNRLPLKAFYRFKVVSRSWSPLIQNLHPPLLLGFFHNSHDIYLLRNGYSNNLDRIFRAYTDSGIVDNSAIDPTLSFLPSTHRRTNLTVLDCCNGLLLCQSGCGSSIVSFVCNPLTKSWTEVDGVHGLSHLDFDPQVSPNFKVVTFLLSHNKLWVRIYSSETRTWGQYSPTVNFDPPTEVFQMLTVCNQKRAFWKGDLYLLFNNNPFSYLFGDDGKIMRVDLHSYESTEIEFPEGIKKPASVFIVRWKDKLRIAGFDWMDNMKQLRLRVWCLLKRDDTDLMVEHDCLISSVNLRGYNQHGWLPQIVGFHPFRDVVFILCRSIPYAYDLTKSSLDTVCPIGHISWDVKPISVFPFSPCLVNFLDRRIGWTTK